MSRQEKKRLAKERAAKERAAQEALRDEEERERIQVSADYPEIPSIRFDSRLNWHLRWRRHVGNNVCRDTIGPIARIPTTVRMPTTNRMLWS